MTVNGYQVVEVNAQGGTVPSGESPARLALLFLHHFHEVKGAAPFVVERREFPLHTIFIHEEKRIMGERFKVTIRFEHPRPWLRQITCEDELVNFEVARAVIEDHFQDNRITFYPDRASSGVFTDFPQGTLRVWNEKPLP